MGVLSLFHDLFHHFFRAYLFQVVYPKAIAAEQLYDKILPGLNKARRISAADYRPIDKVNVSRDAVGLYKIFDALAHREALMRVAAGTASQEAVRQALDALLKDVLPHLSLDRQLCIDDCFFYSMVKERGAYFPNIHWDSDWLQFPDCDGFQMWYLLDNDADEGNMFMVRTPQLKADDGPVRFLLNKDGSATKVHHDIRMPEAPLKGYQKVADCGFDFEYLGMKPGECLVFSKRTLHMSDPRPTLRGEAVKRLALNVRVVIRPPNMETIPFWPGHVYSGRYSGTMVYKFAKKAQKPGPETGGFQHVSVSRHEML